MRRVFTLFMIMALSPIVVNGQFSLEWLSSDLIQGEVDQDVIYHFNLTNESSSSSELRWRIITNDFPAAGWSDYVCDYVCYDSLVRARDLDIEADTTFTVLHHISMLGSEGYGTSQLCFWERSDSAGTIQCITARATTCWDLVPDTLEVEVDDATYHVIDGEVFELHDTNYSAVSASGIIDLEFCSLLTIGKNIVEFDNSDFVEFDDYDKYVLDDEDIYVIAEKSYTYDETGFVEGESVEVVNIDEAEHIIIGGDTFEIYADSLAPLAVSEAQENAVRVFPNPANDLLNISGVSYQSTFVEIFDLTGKLVFSATLKDRYVDVSDLPNGLYSVVISDEEVSDVHKITIVR